MWMVNAIYHSIILYFLPLFLMGYHEIQPDGEIGGYLFLGNAVFGVGAQCPSIVLMHTYGSKARICISLAVYGSNCVY